MNVDNKVIAITGATGGIGEALAQTLAAAGATLLLTGRNEAALAALRNSLPGAQSHTVIAADLRDIGGRSAFVTAAREKSISGIIYCSGINTFDLFTDLPAEQINDMVDLNLNVPMQLTQQLLPLLATADSPFLVFIGSTLGSIGMPGSVAYSATKFGLRGFAQALRRELADTDMGVLYLAPRGTQTTMNSVAVVDMNKALGNAMDPVERVAAECLQRIQKNHWGEHYVGQPEGFFARLNAVLPGLVDRALKKQLSTVKTFIKQGKTV